VSLLSLDIELTLADFSVNIDERIPIDGITALFGPSGSGKTTLLRIIAGLESQARGVLSFDAIEWQGQRTWIAPHDRRVGLVFQDTRLFRNLSVAGNLLFPTRFRRNDGAIKFQEVVDAFELRELLNRKTESLSGGEAQRVAIARSLLANPQLLLMDEPLSSMDSSRKREILPYIERLPKQFAMPVLYVTHDADEVTRLADHLVVLDNGRVSDSGLVEEIFENRKLWSVRGAQEASSILNVVVEDSSDDMTMLSLGSQRLRVPGHSVTLGAHSRIRIHARDVVIATQDVEHLSIRNKLACTLMRAKYENTPYVDLLLDVESQSLRATITRDAYDELNLSEGLQVFALIKSAALDTGS
jgi:molybdate transport system ATP-binding protein